MNGVGVTMQSSSPEPPLASALPQPGQLWSRDYVRLLALQMCFGLSNSAFLLLPTYLRTELQASAAEIGWVTGAALLVAAAAAPLVGSGLGRWSRRWLLFGSMVGIGGTALAFLVVDRVGPLLYGLRVLQGFTFTAAFNTTGVLAASRVPPARMAQGIGYLGLANLATNALAPAVTEPLAHAVGWSLAFASAGLLALLACPWALGVSEAPAEPEVPTVGRGHRGLLPVYYASALIGVGVGVMFTFSQPFALSLGAERVGSFFFGFVLAAVFMRTALARLADRVGPGRVSVPTLLVYGFVVLATALLTPETLPLFGLALGAAHGLIYPALTAFAFSQVAPRRRGPVMGWLGGSYSIGFAFSVLGLGPVADGLGFPSIFLLAGVAILTGVLPLSRVVRQSAS